MTTKPAVLIVGAGPSGLALALLLFRNDITVRIIDKRSNFNVGQRGAGFQPRTLELYKLLGILPEIEKRARSIPKMRIYDINGKVFGQEQHQEFLRQLLEKEYGCLVECETELESFAQDEEKVVVNLVKKGKQETTNVKWLIGADGGRSVVRKQLGLTFTGESHADITSVIGDIEVKMWPDEIDTKVWSVWGNQGEESVFICPYLKDGKQMSFFLVGGGQVDVEGVAANPERIVGLLHGISGRQGIEFGRMYEWQISLAKDGSSSSEFNLAWKLGLVHKGLAPRSLLESYTTERLPVIAAMLEMTTVLMRKDFALTSNTERFERGFETRQLGITYRKSPIIVDERYPDKNETVDPYRSGLDGTVHAGDRAPEAPGLKHLDSGEKTSIYQVFDATSHTVIFFGNSISDIEESLKFVAKYPKNVVKSVLVLPQGSAFSSDSEKALLDHVFSDTDGHTYENYRLRPGDGLFIVVVRPDGYIGAVAKGFSGLKEYFCNILVDN
ncbi:putative monooxygenase [Moniliophthora roreri]|nr:putative monooxygenase [Moniliophthora roreri]